MVPSPGRVRFSAISAAKAARCSDTGQPVSARFSNSFASFLAISMAVLPLLLCTGGSAPASSSASAAATRPSYMARWSGVGPFLSRVLRSAPCFASRQMIPARSSSAAVGSSVFSRRRNRFLSNKPTACAVSIGLLSRYSITIEECTVRNITKRIDIFRSCFAKTRFSHSPFDWKDLSLRTDRFENRVQHAAADRTVE